MSAWAEGRRPITITIVAMGGEGGGVLSDWIVSMGEACGYTAQSTSVAGVAQRTGATVYYVELYPDADPAGESSVRTEPILSLFPTPGQVDVVIASELMEAGRSLQRGFTTPDRTTLITSTNRVYSVTEKMNLGDGRVDDESLLRSAAAGAKKLVAVDFSALAAQAGSVISASLFGGLAGSGALPFARADFEDALRRGGKGVEPSLRAFALGFDAAAQASAPAEKPSGLGPVRVTIGSRRPKDPVAEAKEAEEARHQELATSRPAALLGPDLQDRAGRVPSYAAPARSMLVRGMVRTAVYQGPEYTDLYLDRTARVIPFDRDREETPLSLEVARHTALWMCYQDTIHVAHQKVRSARIQGVRDEAKPGKGQITQVREYLHPQLDEITDTLPTALGRRLSRSKLFAAIVAKVTRDGMIINTTSIVGSTMLHVLAAMRPIRPRSLRYGREQVAIDAWLDTVLAIADRDYDLATEIARLPRVLKGYGQTHAHGSESFERLLAVIPDLIGRQDAAATLARLLKAALADEDGAALTGALATV